MPISATVPRKMHEPSASTVGKVCGKRTCVHMNTGSVVWLPPRNRANRNSSKEVVNDSSREAPTAGRINGNVTRQKVIHPFSPRSSAHSSKFFATPSNRARITSVANGSVTTTWATPTAHSDSGMPMASVNTSRPTAKMMPGITIGSMRKPSATLCPGSRYRVSALAAMVASVVVAMATEAATLRLLPSASSRPGTSAIPAYHLSVKLLSGSTI